jgi:threonine dehydrogenase-like Zn-dependent dehydrogenase
LIACVFDGREVRLDRSYPEPVLGEGDVLIRTRLAGICRTDLEIVKGYMGFRGVLGHEFVGTALGGRYEGKRVVGGINCVCGRCDLCRAGLPTHCRDRTTLGIAGRDGALAERFTLPEANLVPVPDAVSDERAVFAEPLAAAIQIGRQVQFARGEEVVVLGDGRLGQLVARVLRAWGLRPEVVGKSEAKLELLRRLDIPAVPVEDARPSSSARVVVECTGSPDGLAMAMKFVRPRGIIVLKSTVADTAGLDLAPIVVNEVTVVGSRCGPMDEAVEMLARGEVEVEPLVSGVFPLAEAPQALRAADQPEAVKVLVRC